MSSGEYWYLTTPYDRQAARLYDRHYSRAVLWPSSVGKNQIAIANSLVLVTADYSAVWITKYQNPIARNDGKDMWVNQLFRNESNVSSSKLIDEAVKITRWRWWPAVPPDGFTTYIAARCIQSEIPGYCYRRAHPRWHNRGETTAKKLVILNISANQLQHVQPLAPLRFSTQLSIFDIEVAA